MKKPIKFPNKPLEPTLEALKEKTLNRAGLEIQAILKKYNLRIVPVLTISPEGAQGGIKLAFNS